MDPFYNVLGDKMRTIIFDEQHELDLMDEINEFFMKNPQIQVFSIHYATSCMAINDQQIYCFSCMIVYDEKSCS